MRLLQRTIKSYLIYSIIVVIIAIPVFYFIINNMFANDVDEALLQQKKELVHRLNKKSAKVLQKGWHDISGNIEVVPIATFSPNDNLYNINRYDSLTQERIDYRILSANVLIHHKPYRLLIRHSLVDTEDLAQGVVTTQIILLIVLLSGLLLLNRWQSKRIWKPFYHTVNQLKSFDLDKHPSLQLDQTQIREFQNLNNAILQLIKKSYHVYLQQKAFTENAAHEMQTPLAIFQSKLDLLLQSSNLNEEQAGVIQSLSDTTQRLSRLNKSLLLLAKIENRQFIEKKPVNISTIIDKIETQFSQQIEVQKITLVKSLDRNIRVVANQTLMEILVVNLFSNAIRHNIQQGNINICLANNILKINNSGSSLPFDETKIFERFQKSNANKNSVGLGLAIVKQICTVYSFTIEYVFEKQEHIFNINFKPV